MQKRSKILTASLATVAGTASVLVSAVPAHAAVNEKCLSQNTANMCTGFEQSGNSIRASASIIDRDGGPNLSVKVRDVKLQRLVGGTWTTIRTVNDYDGWHAYGDTAATAYVNPCSYSTRTFRTVATHDYKGVIDGTSVTATRTVVSGSYSASGCGTSSA